MKSGLAFHVHHDQLIEFCYDYDERVRFIRENKPIKEQGLRLRLLQMIPMDKLPKRGLDAYDEARNAYDEAWDVYDEARNAYAKARNAYVEARDAYVKARNAYVKARDAYVKARDAFAKARDAFVNKNKKALEKLHEELCPNCPWDGKTIIERG